jgi:ornithine decarboxylase
VTTVIGTKERQGGPWYILDEGVYGALSGIIFDHWSYPLHCFGHGARQKATFAGPSCDGIDVLYRDVMVPRQHIGDHVLITEIGSYSTVSATRFNGFGLAPVLIWEEQPEAAKRQEQESQPVVQEEVV